MAQGFFTLHLNSKDVQKIESTLRQFPKVERTAAVRSAFNRAMTPMLKAARQNIESNNKEGTGILKKSLTKRAYPSKLLTKAGGKRGGGAHGAILHLVDRGTKARRQKKTGRYTGIMYAGRGGYRWGGKMYQPHGRPGAWKSAWIATRDKVGKIIIDGLDKAVRKLIG
jgi:hypothetical protein